MKKRKSIVYVCTMLIITSIIGVICALGAMEFNMNTVKNELLKQNEIVVKHQESEINNIKTIKIKSINSDIKINYIEEQKIKVDYTDSKVIKYKLEITEGLFSFKPEKTINWDFNMFLGFSSYDSTITLSIPNNIKFNIIFETINGDLKFENGNFNQVQFDSVNGDINFTNLICESLNTETVNGSITGSITTKNIKSETVNGKIKLTITGLLEDYKVTCNTLNGVIKINENSYHKNVVLNTDKLQNINLKTLNGNITILFQ